MREAIEQDRPLGLVGLPRVWLTHKTTRPAGSIPMHPTQVCDNFAKGYPFRYSDPYILRLT